MRKYVKICQSLYTIWRFSILPKPVIEISNFYYSRNMPSNYITLKIHISERANSLPCLSCDTYLNSWKMCAIYIQIGVSKRFLTPSVLHSTEMFAFLGYYSHESDPVFYWGASVTQRQKYLVSAGVLLVGLDRYQGNGEGYQDMMVSG